jgi:hypothetical protein
MQSLSLPKESRVLRPRSESPQARLEINSVEMSTVTMRRGGNIDDELELIEMRYQEGLALANLEAVFAQGLVARE